MVSGENSMSCREGYVSGSRMFQTMQVDLGMKEKAVRLYEAV